MTKIIGIELRAYSRLTGARVEMTVLPCQIVLPDTGYDSLGFDVTLHTSNAGDHTFGFPGRLDAPIRTSPDPFDIIVK